jgi:hypothetical protein
MVIKLNARLIPEKSIFILQRCFKLNPEIRRAIKAGAADIWSGKVCGE